MNARWLLNLTLLLAVVIAGAVLLFKPQIAGREAYRLTTGPSDKWREIVLQRGEMHIKLEREDSEWRMREPVNARIEETVLARLLDLTRLELSSRLAAVELDRYGLDKPWARVRFGEQLIELGSTNTVTQELYARSGDYVYAIPARYAGAVPADAAKLLAHRMLSPSESPVAFRLGRFSVANDGARWQVDPPDPNLSQDDLVRWVDQWRLASSVITMPARPAPAASTLVVVLKSNREITFEVVGRTPDLVLRRRDEGLDYHFPARMASLLLEPPSAAKPGQ